MSNEPMFEPGDDGTAFNDAGAFIEHILDHLRKGEFEIDDVVDVITNMLGIKDNNTHDIIREVRFGLVMLDEKQLADRLGAAWLHQMKWGFGLRLGFEGDSGDNLTPVQNEKLATIIAAVFRIGGIDATAHGGKIRMTRDGRSSETDIADMTDMINQFRQEIDEELGPDAPTVGEGWDRWGL
jgi:uncharacterized FlaG/YvyC family protein